MNTRTRREKEAALYWRQKGYSAAEAKTLAGLDEEERQDWFASRREKINKTISLEEAKRRAATSKR